MSFINLLTKHPKRAAALFSFIVFVVYALMTPTFNVGYGDSDEFLTVGETGGIAHPPGYTLYVTALHLAMKLPLPGTTPAWRGHAVSGLAMSIAIYYGILFLYAISAEDKKSKQKSFQITRIMAIYTAALSVASAKLVWTYSLIAEKYIFAAPFVMSILYYSVLLLQKGQKESRQTQLLGIVSLVYGLLLSHHQSTVFLFPYIVYIVAQVIDRKSAVKRILIAGGGIILGFCLPLLLITYRVNHLAPISWKTEPTLQGIVNLITRKDFQGEIVDRGMSSNGYIPESITLNQIISTSKAYTMTLMNSFSWWILIPFIFAALSLWRQKDKSFMVVTVLPAALMGYVLAWYLGWPSDLGTQATTVRFYTLGFILLLPIIYLGMKELLDRVLSAISVLSTNQKAPQIALGIIGCIPVLVAVCIGQSISLKKFPYVSMLYGNMLNQFDQNSLVTCYSDTSCFALLYEQTVNHKRPDVVIVPTAYPLNQSQINLKNLQRFTYTANPYLLKDIVTWNIGKRPVYAVDLSSYYYNLFGIDYAFMYYIPYGYYGKLDRQLPQTLPTYDDSLTKMIVSQGIDENDLMQRRIIKAIAQTHFTNAHIDLMLSNRTQARLELNDAVNLSYELTKTEKDGAIASRNTIEQTEPHEQYVLGRQVLGADALLARLPGLYKQNKNSQAYWLVMGALTVDPTNVNARLELARIYNKMGDTNFTRLEYQHVLMLDPTNQEALDQLVKL